MTRLSRSVALLILLRIAASAGATDWPQWLGPTRDGVSTETVTPWKSAPNVVWRQNVAEGHSSPIVAGGTVYLHTRVADKDEEEVRAFDAKTGEPRWRTPYPRSSFGSPFGTGPRGTPAFADGKIYTLGVTGILSCLDASDGKLVWQVDTLKRFKGNNLLFGVSNSPLIEGRMVLVNVGAKGASIVAFDKMTGEVVWQALDDGASYSSPIAFGEGANRQVVFLTQDGLVSLRPTDGTVFWRFRFRDLLSESSTTPVKIGDVLLGSSVTYGSIGLKLGKADTKPDATKLWKNNELTCYFSTPVAVGIEHVYLVTGTAIPPASATLHCVETKTGKTLWSHPKSANIMRRCFAQVITSF